MTTSTAQGGADPKVTLRILEMLGHYHFGDAEFRLFHHWGSKGRLSGFLRHCNQTQRFREGENNHRLHQRLEFVLDCCEEGALDGGKTFAALAIEAFHKYPKV